MKTINEMRYKLNKDNMYKEYIRAFKNIWEYCTCHPDEIIMRYDNYMANFAYKIGEISLDVAITKDCKIYYEIRRKDDIKVYKFQTKEDYELYEDFKNYLFYHFDRLLKSCYNCATDTTGYFKVKNVDGIHKLYEDML